MFQEKLDEIREALEDMEEELNCLHAYGEIEYHVYSRLIDQVFRIHDLTAGEEPHANQEDTAKG